MTGKTLGSRMPRLLALLIALLSLSSQETLRQVSPREIRKDPSLLGLCASPLTAVDVHSAAMAVLARVEDAMRRAKCSPSVFSGIPTLPSTVRVPLREMNTFTADDLNSDPVGAVFKDNVAQASARLLASAEQCRLEWDALSTVLGAAMQHMANIAACDALQRDILRNRMAAGAVHRQPPGNRAAPQSSIGRGYVVKASSDAIASSPVLHYHGPDGVPYVRDRL